MPETDRVPQGSDDAPWLSVVVPMFREAANVDALFARLVPVLDRIGVAWEAICVDDGSPDDTAARVIALRAREPRVRLLRLSRNFGKEIALTAGLHHADGDAAVMIDADLQHPPELIAEMVAQWREGFDVVYAERESRDTDSVLRRAATRGFYWLFGRLSDVTLPPGAGDFRLLDRRVIDAINAMPERARFMKGIYAWVGFRQIGLKFSPPARAAGRSAWSPRQLFRFAFDGLTAFSNLPLIAWGYVGAAIATISLLAGAFFFVRTLLFGVDVPGYASLIVAVLFFGGVQLLTLGILGGYVGRVFEEVKRRPLYLIAEAHGFTEVASARDRRAISGAPAHPTRASFRGEPGDPPVWPSGTVPGRSSAGAGDP